VFYFN